MNFKNKNLTLLNMVIAKFSFKILISLLFQRLSIIILIYIGVLKINTFYIQSIGSGIGIYKRLFHVTLSSKILYVCIFIISIIIYRTQLKFKSSLRLKSTQLLNLYKIK